MRFNEGRVYKPAELRQPSLNPLNNQRFNEGRVYKPAEADSQLRKRETNMGFNEGRVYKPAEYHPAKLVSKRIIASMKGGFINPPK